MLTLGIRRSGNQRDSPLLLKEEVHFFANKNTWKIERASCLSLTVWTLWFLNLQKCHRKLSSPGLFKCRLIHPCFPNTRLSNKPGLGSLIWHFSYRKATQCSIQRFQERQLLDSYSFNPLSSQICFASMGNVISKCNIHFPQLTLTFRYKWPGFYSIF